MIRVAVVYGGVSAEHEVSVVSARSVLDAIDRSKYDVVPIAIAKTGEWLLPHHPPQLLDAGTGRLPSVDPADGAPIVVERGGEVVGSGRAADQGTRGRVDVVFPVLHGPGGEDGTIQGLLESIGVPYVGAGVAASVLGMDKSLQKPIFERAGIPIAPWLAIARPEFEADPRAAVSAVIQQLGLPCFSKPSSLGSSVGVMRCTTDAEVSKGLEEAFAHGPIAVLERAIEGRELECAVLGNDAPEVSVVGEIIPGREFYDYEDKYLGDAARIIVPADIPAATAERTRALSLRAFAAIRCAGMARVDFFLRSDGELMLNEINTIPGFTPISMYPKLWDASGVPYPALIDRLIELALDRVG